MSSVDEDNDISICANCGKSEEESHKLKHCNACKLVKYCNRECQVAHRPQHKKVCRKRAAEFHDEKLFKQPPPQFGDCPICFIRLPILETGRRYKTCCGKVICSGCIHAPLYDDQGNKVDNKKCAFCRTPAPTTDEEVIRRTKKRIDLDDPIAIFNHANNYHNGKNGFPQNYAKALELWHRACELGFAEAYCGIGYAYDNGGGVEVDKKKAKHYYELASMMGNETARHNLGANEADAGNWDRAVKHWMIAAGSGFNPSLKYIQDFYSNGRATKEDYTKALKLYQTYLSEIKSTQRDKAAAAREDYRFV